jgi:uncharacterized protein YyaL (SSP411 family)
MPNRLADETSPYLLQHKDNPVDWYPWGPEALERARAEDRPILLSVGYSACHWCHVMEHESFENEATARLMNERFVNVKVDREERPDVDSVYMTAVQQMTGRGGWPMTVFLTPEGAPFYGGTYYPPEPRHGMPSFEQVLRGISEAYSERRDQVERSAGELREMLRGNASLKPPAAAIGPAVLDEAYRRIAGRYDPRDGGFGGASKFPQPMILELLLRYWRRTGEADALRMVDHTLERMWRGGMYDHLGGGFHRYSVDAKWLVPHFEKMLYDNALLSRVYTNAHLATGEARHRLVAEEILDYVAREMTSSDGGFYSAQDADSEGEEGRFYVWDPEEVDSLLGTEDGRLFRLYYDVRQGGNFEGRSILHPDRPLAAVAAGAGVPEPRLTEIVNRGRTLLHEARAKRIAPARDEKVLTSWNAMMMRSFAEAAAAFDDGRYLEIAVRNAELILGTLRPHGRLKRTYKDGQARIPAFLEDHALLVDALVSLYQVGFDVRWIREARVLADAMLELFWDAEAGVFYDAASDAEQLVVRPRDYYDNATPSGSSAAVSALLRLSALTGEERYRAVAVRVLEDFASPMMEAPQGFGELLSALAFHLAPPKEVAIAGGRERPDTVGLLGVLRRRYLPDVVVALAEPEASPEVAEAVPLVRDRPPVGGSAAAYVCQQFVCGRPVTAAGDLEALLASPAPVGDLR